MRLVNSVAFRNLCNMGLSQPIFNTSKLLLCYGEHLKEAEQSLIFLNRCKSSKFYPVFILKTVTLSDDILPFKNNQHSDTLLDKLRLFILNQHIRKKYQMIIEFKYNIDKLKNELKQLISSWLFLDIIELFKWLLCQTKSSAKQRLKHTHNTHTHTHTHKHTHNHNTHSYTHNHKHGCWMTPAF